MRWLLTLCAMLLSSLLTAQTTDRAAELRQQALQLSAQADNLGALRAYRDAVELDPSRQSFGELRSFVSTRGLSDADKEALQALATEMTLAYAAKHKDEWTPVALLVQVAQPSVAEKSITSWLAANPNDISALSARATVRAKQKRYDDAIADWEKLIALDPHDPSRHFEIGSTLLDIFLEDETTDPAALRRAIARTERALRRARELQPSFAPATSHLGGLLELKSKLTDDGPEKVRLSAEAETLQREGMAQMRKSAAKLFNIAFVTITQGSHRAHITDRDVVTLERAPFEIELTIGQAVPVLLNVHDTDAIQRATDRGFRLESACTASGPFCPANFVKESPRNADQRLLPGPRASHNLYFQSAEDHAWSEVSEKRFRRVVSKIGDVPLAAMKAKALYFTLVIDRDADGMLGLLEPLRFTMRFR